MTAIVNVFVTKKKKLAQNVENYWICLTAGANDITE